MITAVYFDGNSLTQSRGGVTAYPDLIGLRASDGTFIATANVSVGGSTTPQQDARAVLAIDVDQRLGDRWVVMWEGANDLYFGATAADAIAHLGAYCSHRHAAGFKVMLVSLLPRGDVGAPVTYEVNRQLVNAWLRQNWHTIAESFVDVAADVLMGHAGQETDERFYLKADRVHLNLAGAQTVAGYVAVALAVEQAK